LSLKVSVAALRAPSCAVLKASVSMTGCEVTESPIFFSYTASAASRALAPSILTTESHAELMVGTPPVLMAST